MKTFRTLDLATDFYSRVQKLKIEGHLRDQLLRGSSSIALESFRRKCQIFSGREEKVLSNVLRFAERMSDYLKTFERHR